MGYSLSWAAVRGGTPQAVQDVLGLRGTGRREEIPESDTTGAELPGGWYLIVSTRDGLDLLEDAVLSQLSQLGEVVMCFVEEHVMSSYAASWRNGQLIWSVDHDSGGRKGIETLHVKGQLPPSFEAIRDRLYSEQAAAGGNKADVDFIFDIPVDLAHSFTGYRHDEDIPGLSKYAFEVLERTISKRLSWWKRLVK